MEKIKGPQIATELLNKKYKASGIPTPEYKMYCRPVVIKTASRWHKDRNEDQWDRIQFSEIIPYQLIFEKLTKTNPGMEDPSTHDRKMANETRSLPYSVYKNQLKMDQGATSMNGYSQIIREGIGKTLKILGIGKDLEKTPEAQEVKAKDKQTGLYQAKNRLQGRETLNQSAEESDRRGESVCSLCNR